MLEEDHLCDATGLRGPCVVLAKKNSMMFHQCGIFWYALVLVLLIPGQTDKSIVDLGLTPQD